MNIVVFSIFLYIFSNDFYSFTIKDQKSKISNQYREINRLESLLDSKNKIYQQLDFTINELKNDSADLDQYIDKNNYKISLLENQYKEYIFGIQQVDQINDSINNNLQTLNSIKSKVAKYQSEKIILISENKHLKNQIAEINILYNNSLLDVENKLNAFTKNTDDKLRKQTINLTSEIEFSIKQYKVDINTQFLDLKNLIKSLNNNNFKSIMTKTNDLNQELQSINIELVSLKNNELGSIMKKTDNLINEISKINSTIINEVDILNINLDNLNNTINNTKNQLKKIKEY